MTDKDDKKKKERQKRNKWKKHFIDRVGTISGSEYKVGYGKGPLGGR